MSRFYYDSCNSKKSSTNNCEYATCNKNQSNSINNLENRLTQLETKVDNSLMEIKSMFNDLTNMIKYLPGLGEGFVEAKSSFNVLSKQNTNKS